MVMVMVMAITIQILTMRNINRAYRLADWLIYLDYLEENNQNTSFLRLITPIIFGIFQCYYYNYNNGSGYGNGNNKGYGYGYGYGYGLGDGNGDGFGNGNGNGDGDGYISSYDEEH